MVVQELLGLGVVKVGIVSEDPARYRHLDGERIEVFGLERHAEALEQFKEIAGTTVLILDKECATEKGRRRRRQGLTPDEYVLIDEDICEAAETVTPSPKAALRSTAWATEFGDKTQVRQAQCAQDGLCIDGECPSFAVVKPAKGTRLRRRRPEPLDELPEPPERPLDRPYAIFAMGRGGTGVVTISHLIAYAAMMEGKYVYLSNNTGLAQKGGPVEAPDCDKRRRAARVQPPLPRRGRSVLGGLICCGRPSRTTSNTPRPSTPAPLSAPLKSPMRR